MTPDIVNFYTLWAAFGLYQVFFTKLGLLYLPLCDLDDHLLLDLTFIVPYGHIVNCAVHITNGS